MKQDRAHALGIDLGGTKVSAALADRSGTIVAEETWPTDPGGGDAVLDQIHGMALRLCGQAGLAGDSIRSIVLGAPGVADPRSGAILLAPNIRDFDRLDIRGGLQTRFGQNVTFENDVNVAALGEAWLGTARGCSDMAFLSLGTGIGLGLIVNHELVRGAHGAGGEVCFLPLGRDLASEEAKVTGALELEVGSAGIIRRYGEAGGSGALTVRQIFDRLREGDSAAQAVLRETAETVALAITAICALLDPAIVVLGGGIGSRPEMRSAIAHVLPKVFARPVDLRTSSLGERAGVLGAVAAAVRHLHRSERPGPHPGGLTADPVPGFGASG